MTAFALPARETAATLPDDEPSIKAGRGKWSLSPAGNRAASVPA